MSRWPYNTKRWQSLRIRVLRESPLCVYCNEIGVIQKAEVVDHIVPVREKRDLAFERSNLQSLCKRCHDGPKQIEEKTGKRIGCGVDGVPFDTSSREDK